MPGIEELLADVEARLRRQETQSYPWQGRVDTYTAGGTTLTAATADYVAPPDGAGPDTIVRVGPSGRLMVSVTARLAVTNAGSRLYHGWQATGPYLDAELTADPEETPAALAVAPHAARALSFGAVGDLTATCTTETSGLAPGYYQLQSRYFLTGPAGALSATATYRQLIAVPL